VAGAERAADVAADGPEEFAVRVAIMGELVSLVGEREMRLALPRGATVGDLLERMAETYGEGFRSRVFSAPGRLHHTMLIFVDGEDSKQLGELAAPLGSGEVEVFMLPMIGGGGG